MLIVSKFHDYYDTACVHGIDKTCVYKREEIIVPIKESSPHYLDKDRWPYEDNLESKHLRYEAHRLLVGFCGEIYPFVHIVRDRRDDFYFYDKEALSEFLTYEGIKERRAWYNERDMRVCDPRAMSIFFDQSTWVRFQSKFADHHTPVFLYGRLSNQKLQIKLNVCLKDLRFMVVKDPQTAFQDIHMYLSGVLGAPPPPKEKIDDKIMAASKGHDGPYSFRKPPGKRGKKQWR